MNRQAASARSPENDRGNRGRGGAFATKGKHASPNLQRAVGNAGARILVQAKLAVGASGDSYEQEADRVADHVMGLSSRPSGEHIHAVEGRAQRHAAGMAASQGEPGGLWVDRSLVDGARRSGGAPLDPTTREFMERRFDRDFGEVRIHNGSDAHDSAHALDALGYTVGRDIVFAAGSYTPHTPQGKWLLAHELAHVVQQGGGSRDDGGRGGGRGKSIDDLRFTIDDSGRSSGPGGAGVNGSARTRSRVGTPQTSSGSSSSAGRGLSATSSPTVQRMLPNPAAEARKANAPRIAEMRKHIEAMRTRFAEPRYASVRAQATQALDTATSVIDHYEKGSPRSGGAAPMVGLAQAPPPVPVPVQTPVASPVGITPLGAGVVVGIALISFIWGSAAGGTAAPSFKEVEAAVERMDELLDKMILSLPPSAPTVAVTPVTPPAPAQAPAASPQGAQGQGTQTVTINSNPSPARNLVADSNIFMDRQNPQDELPVKALLASAGTNLYVPAAAWGEVIKGDKYGTQKVRLAGIPGGARVIPDLDGNLTGIHAKALVPSRQFNENDMKIVQRAKERSFPLVTVNVGMINEIQDEPHRKAQWGAVPIIRP